MEYDILDAPKTIVRKIIVRNPDGTTKLVQQKIVQAPSASAATPSNEGKPNTQKVQIIRGPDGKITYHGLNPGQRLIQMPDGKLHILTSRAAQNKTPNATKTTKVLTPGTPIQSSPTLANVVSAGKSPMAVRQQLIKQTPTGNVLVKSIGQKLTNQRVSFITSRAEFSVTKYFRFDIGGSE